MNLAVDVLSVFVLLSYTAMGQMNKGVMDSPAELTVRDRYLRLETGPARDAASQALQATRAMVPALMTLLRFTPDLKS